LVDELMVLAKSRRPDFARFAPVELDHLIESVVDKAAGLGARSWVVDAEPGLVISADSQRLTQALLQLADNAVRHTAPGDRIEFGVRRLGADVALWVADCGDGVPLADQERIFKRFARASEGTGRGDHGSGLGLAIVSAIAAAHNGRVLLDSSPGHGATFTVVLPADLATTAAAHPVKPPHVPSGGPPRVASDANARPAPSLLNDTSAVSVVAAINQHCKREIRPRERFARTSDGPSGSGGRGVVE
jgi:signal transduction histidine kinase